MPSCTTPPYVLVEPQPDGTNNYSGYLYDVWTIIAERLNLRFKMQPLPGGGYGILNSNGTWTGLVGELAYGRADVALSMLSIREDRKEVVDFIDTVPVWETGYSFYVRRGTGGMPPLTSGTFSALLKPLHVDVWWALLATLIVLSVALRISLRFNHPRAESRRVVEEMCWGTCLLHCFMSLVRQGWSVTPNSLAARIVTITIWILTTIIIFSYAANLISHLTIRTVNRPISSLREFSERPDWRFAIQPGHVILSDWKLSADPYERELYQRSETGNGFIALGSTNETMRSAIEPNVLAYLSIRQLLFSVGMEGCNLVPLLDLPTTSDRHYLAVAKNQTRLYDAISLQLLRMTEAGLLSRLETQWMSSQPTCSPPEDTRAMSGVDLMALLVVPLLAALVSSGVLGLEWAWYLWLGREGSYGLPH